MEPGIIIVLLILAVTVIMLIIDVVRIDIVAISCMAIARAPLPVPLATVIWMPLQAERSVLFWAPGFLR